MVSFQLLWVVLIGLIFALTIQSLAANLGVTTGKTFKYLIISKKLGEKKHVIYLTVRVPTYINSTVLLISLIKDLSFFQLVLIIWRGKFRKAPVGAVQN